MQGNDVRGYDGGRYGGVGGYGTSACRYGGGLHGSPRQAAAQAPPRRTSPMAPAHILVLKTIVVGQ
jgi:hypothetical protein